MINTAPKTPQDWWDLLISEFDGLCKTVQMASTDRPQGQRPYWDHETKSFEIKLCAEFAGAAEPETYLERFIWSVVNRDAEVALEILQSTWERAPDNASIHYRPSWGVLCDLCSESWVFEDEEWMRCLTGQESAK